MKIKKALIILGLILLVVNMIIATQYAITRVGYEYAIVHPSNADIRFIGSDNSTGGRLLRVDGTNSSIVSLKLSFGNWSAGTNKIYSAAFGIVNEEDVPVQIKYINVSSVNYSYMRIWLHGNRQANANRSTTDPTTIEMYNNGTIVNATNTTAWTLAAGNGNTSDMCSNVSNRTAYKILTPWDNTSHVRYSTNNTNAYSVNTFNRTANNASDFVWVQIAIELPTTPDIAGIHSGSIYFHFEADTIS